MREVREEIGLDLTQKDNIYIGKLPINLFTYLKRGKNTYISNIVYLTLSNVKSDCEREDPTEVVNLSVPNSEVQEAWWVPFNSFYTPNNESLTRNYSRKPTASWLLNTHLNDLLTNDTAYRTLIEANFSQIKENEPQVKDFESPLDGLLNILPNTDKIAYSDQLKSREV